MRLTAFDVDLTRLSTHLDDFLKLEVRVALAVSDAALLARRCLARLEVTQFRSTYQPLRAVLT
jgi:hypothetical protein